MEEDVDKRYRKVCSACLSSNRNLIIYEDDSEVYQIFRLLMYDFAGELVSLTNQRIQMCWECVAIMKRFSKFKKQVHAAQANITAFSTADHAYTSRSLSSLSSMTKKGYDRVYLDNTKSLTGWSPQYLSIGNTDIVKNEGYDIAQAVRENINLELEENILGSMVLDTSSTVPHIVINAGALASQETYKSNEFMLPELTIRPCSQNNGNILIENKQNSVEDRTDLKAGYLTEYMGEDDMLAFRELAKEKIQYASAVYKCELCIMGFYNQQQVEEHYVSAHKARPGTVACKVCFVYVEAEQQASHTQTHYVRHVCRTCGHAEGSARLAQLHVRAHRDKRPPGALIQIGDTTVSKKIRKRKQKEIATSPLNSEPQNLRKLLSKTTIVGYKCLECDMFFKNSRARKNHVARFHREGLQCDHCKKRFVNKTTLATHLKLHEGPPPRAECPICRKMVRAVQLKYHVQRHQSKGRYECVDCNKTFSHLTTYHAHLKYSRAHASDQVFKFPCPMCNKGYPTKEAMQDHFNYQHLGKTSHKCPKCDKPIASKANVEKHMMRVHGEKKEKPRNHVCQQCGKGFTDKKALNQHEVIHSGDRPLSCDICHQTFKQKASLYTHRKRVHNVVPMKRVVEFIDTKNSVQN